MPNFDQDFMTSLAIFRPDDFLSYKDVIENDRKFVYYTTAETAEKIITNSEIWMRNSTVMNDFSEISYGLMMVELAIEGEAGHFWRSAIESIYPGSIGKLRVTVENWHSVLQSGTYLSCVSNHIDAENTSGRLSMWRAYGNVALVLNKTPMMSLTNGLGVYSTPVNYRDKENYSIFLDRVSRNILDNKDWIINRGEDTFISNLTHMLYTVAIATKHPGFHEEKEWRIFYRPWVEESAVVTEKRVVISGIPQVIYCLRLSNDPDNGLHGAAIPDLLERIIIGPSAYPHIICHAFARALQEHGIQNARERITVSDIPLRSG